MQALTEGILSSPNFWVPLLIILYADVSETIAPTKYPPIKLLSLGFLSSWLVSGISFIERGIPTKGTSIVAVSMLFFYWYLKPGWMIFRNRMAFRNISPSQKRTFLTITAVSAVASLNPFYFPITLGYFLFPAVGTIALHVLGLTMFVILFLIVFLYDLICELRYRPR